jgi:hypothetical protein
MRALVGHWSQVASSRLAASASASSDAYAAADYVSHAGPLNTTRQSEFQTAVFDLAHQKLTASAQPIYAVSYAMVNQYRGAVLAVCGLQKSYSRASSSLGALDQRLLTVQSLAASKPWYPKGYSEFSDGIAWRWVNNPSFSDPTCLDGSSACWQVNVVVRDGCPTSLYVEATTYSAGSAVGFTNGTTGALNAGDTALVELVDATGTADSARLTTIDCY